MMQTLRTQWTQQEARKQRAGLSDALHRFVLATTLTLLLALSPLESVYARHAPNRHDRRPDRETRITYPRTSQASTRRGVTIHSAPPSETPAPTPDPVENQTREMSPAPTE